MVRILFFFLILCSAAQGAEVGGLYIDPRLAVGFNSAQGTHYMVGLDVGYAIDEHWSAGVGAYGSAGEEPKHDRELGVGPFVGFAYPLGAMLTGHLRQEVNYVDLYEPIKTGSTYDHEREMGVASVSQAGLHLHLGPLGVALGYRLVVGLTNSDLDDGRSGTFLGFAIGI